MGVPLYVICCFSLAVFSILSLSLIFLILIMVCLGVFLFQLILYGTLCAQAALSTQSLGIINYSWSPHSQTNEAGVGVQART